MLKKKLNRANDWINTFFNPSYICHDMNIFWPASFVKFPWCCCTKFNQSWKDLRKTLVFVQIHKTGYFECSWCPKKKKKKKFIINKQKRAVSAASALLDHLLTELYLQNWVPRLQVLHSFLNNGLTWYVHLKVLARYVNSILYLPKKYQKYDAKGWTYHCSTCIEYIYLNQNCIDTISCWFHQM